MFITKKKLEKLLEEKEKQTAEKYERSMREHDQYRWVNERIDHIERRLDELAEYKRKYEEVCKAVKG